MKPRVLQLARRQGIIFILSAPSGASKTTLYNGLRKGYPDIQLSVSCTTRARRRDEGQPALAVHRLLISAEDQPLAYGRIVEIGERFKLETELERIR